MRHALLISALFLALAGAASDRPVATFTENHGQWPEQVLYRALFPGGALFVEKNALTYLLVKGGPMEHHGDPAQHPTEPFAAHAYRVTFEGSTGGHPLGELAQPQYENFFIGNDPAAWGVRCGVFGEVWVKGLYPGIDLRLDGRQGIKYDLIVAPEADPATIRMRFDGQDELELINGRLLVRTSAGQVEEEAPRSFLGLPSASGNARVPTASSYRLRANVVSFDVKDPDNATLIIDPDLTFASFSGSAANNFGFTATYDNDGALYGGGIAFGFGYPVTLGVQQGSSAGGNIDIGISKWTPDGTDLEWSTYLGGSNNETPTSLVVNSSNELYVLVITGSADFPTTSGCSDASFNGGVTIPISGGFVNLLGGEGYGFSAGTDIAVTHFSSDCTSLIASTFIGGTGNDGLNQSADLVHNYGDHFRGEIALDPNEHPVVASSSQSVDLPVTANAPQPAFGGGAQDAVLFRLDPALSNLELATYCGGAGDESGYGVQFASNGEVFMTGGTSSGDLPMAGTPFDASYNGGNDGYIMRYDASGSTLLSATYVGTSAYDETYFVQLNTSDEVYVVGQTHGAYPITPGKYANPGSAQFIHKFSQDLGTSLWSTRFGNGSGVEDLAPSAFLVSDCGQIYFSGWGGSVNSNVLAAQSTTAGLPLTSNAFQSNTDGSDYYLMVLDPEAAGLNYATYIGGGLSPEHVDGGTSRFDKNGTVYQAVCAGCWNNSDFPTTPGAWSNTNGAGPAHCNLAVFKFNLTLSVASIQIDGPGYVCFPAEAGFSNSSIGGTNYQWDFGDNTTSTAFEPTHTYSDTGVYVVSMILSDSTACIPPDTARITIHVRPLPHAIIDPVDPVCTGATVQLHAHGGYSFAWYPAAGLSDTTIADPIVTADTTSTFRVIVTDSCGTDTASIDVIFGTPSGEAGPDTVTCTGSGVPITATGGASYQWSPTASLDDPNAASPIATPADTTQYHVIITSAEGCVREDSLTVNVIFDLPDPMLSDTAVCRGSSVQLHAGGGTSYAWRPAPGISSLDVSDPSVQPDQDQYYVVTMTNACGSVLDSAWVDVQEVIAHAWPDTTVCPGAEVTLFASGGTQYAWEPASGLSAPDSSVTRASPAADVQYTVTASNTMGCQGTATLTVGHFALPYVNAGYDTGVDFGENVQLLGTGIGSMVWSPAASLSCDSCIAPVATPQRTTVYTVELTDVNGCRITDQVTVFVNGTLYVPNTFTPDGDGINDGFVALATEVKDYQLRVFNRWGEEIFASARLEDPWDGTFHGVRSPIDTYVWRIDLTELNGKKRTVFGHVNLVR